MNKDWLKPLNPVKKYNKFTLAAEKIISYTKKDIEDMGFIVISGRIIDNIYIL